MKHPSEAAPRTIEAYESDWSLFQRWCASVSKAALPAQPKTVCSYLTHLADPHETTRVYATKAGPKEVTRIVSCKYSTIERALVSIGIMHKRKGAPNPVTDQVREVLAGIRHWIGTKRTKKAALFAADLRRIFMNVADADAPIAIRDRVVALFGFTGAFRRSELAALNIENLTFTREGLLVTLGQGRIVPIFRGTGICAVRAVERWLDVLDETRGPLFRPFRGSSIQTCRMRPRVVARIVKRYAALLDRDPAEFAGHSLRRGHITQRKRNGDSDADIMRVTGHKNLQTLAEYNEEAKNPFDLRVRLGL